MVCINKLDFARAEKQIFKGFSLTLPENGVFALMGESGIGKTTLLRLLAGLEKPDRGTITGLQDKKIAFLFQEDRLLLHRSALTNVSLVSDAQEAAYWLKALQIPDPSLRPAALSGGMQRRVALARALAYGGDVLILDEPFTGLDRPLIERIVPKLLQSSAPLVLLSTHNAEDAALLGADVIRI